MYILSLVGMLLMYFLPVFFILGMLFPRYVLILSPSYRRTRLRVIYLSLLMLALLIALNYVSQNKLPSFDLLK